MPPRARKQQSAPAGSQDAQHGRPPAAAPSGTNPGQNSFLQQLRGRMAMIRQAALDASPQGSSPSRPRPATPSLTPTLSSTPPSPPGPFQCTPNSASTQRLISHPAPQQIQQAHTTAVTTPSVLFRRSASPPPPSQASPAHSSASPHSTPSPPLHARQRQRSSPGLPAAQAPSTPCAPMPTPASPPRPPLSSLAATASPPVSLLCSRERKRRLQDQQTAAALHAGAAPEPAPRKQARRAGAHSGLDGERPAVTRTPTEAMQPPQSDPDSQAVSSPTSSAAAPAVKAAPATPMGSHPVHVQGCVVDGGTLYPPGMPHGTDYGAYSGPAAAGARVPSTAAAGTAGSEEGREPTRSPGQAQHPHRHEGGHAAQHPRRRTGGHAAHNRQRTRTAPDSNTPHSGSLLGSPASTSPPSHHQLASPASSVHTASTSSTPALNPRAVLWTPPVSPFSLLEEVLYEDPWKLLVACMLLNKTSSTQVRLILGRLFALYPTAESLAALHQPPPARTTTKNTTTTTKSSRGRRAGSGSTKKGKNDGAAAPSTHAGSMSGSPSPPDARGEPPPQPPPTTLHTITTIPHHQPPPSPPPPGPITAHQTPLHPPHQPDLNPPACGSPASVFTPTPSASPPATNSHSAPSASASSSLNPSSLNPASSSLKVGHPPSSLNPASSSLKVGDPPSSLNPVSSSRKAGHPPSSPPSSSCPTPPNATQPALAHTLTDSRPVGSNPCAQCEGAHTQEPLPAAAEGQAVQGHTSLQRHGTPSMPAAAGGGPGAVTVNEAGAPHSHAASTALTQLQQLLRPLGLYRKRALMLARFSYEYLHVPWTDPRELHGIGDYAADAYWIFCRGRWHDIYPADKDLRRYKEWLLETGGEGAGLQRESLADVLSAPPGASKTDHST